jgi:prefoldin alpha subunit
MSEQELNMKFAMFEQQIKAIQQQLQAVEQAIGELTGLNVGMKDLIGKTDSEIMAPIGRGIYVKAKLLSEDLTVDVGGKTFVKKSIPDTQKLISEQLAKLSEVREDLNSELEKINGELTNVFMEHQKTLKHDHDCACEEGCQGEKCEEEGKECGCK